jgi:hypothetical protein
VRHGRRVALGIDGDGHRRAARADDDLPRRHGLPARGADRARREDGREDGEGGGQLAQQGGHRPVS